MKILNLLRYLVLPKNQRDENGKKHGYWVTYVTPTIGLPWKAIEKKYIHGKPHGTAIFYYGPKVRAKVETYNMGVLNGPYYSYIDGVIRLRGAYKNGLKFGSWAVQRDDSVRVTCKYIHIKRLHIHPHRYSKNTIVWVEQEFDEKGRTIKLRKHNTKTVYLAEVTYNDNDEVETYKDYLGNWYNKKNFTRPCALNIDDLWYLDAYDILKFKINY